MKILLCCNAGMSTSLLVSKMQKIDEFNRVEAISIDMLDEKISDCDVVLLGPQIGFKLEELRKKCTVPVEKIPPQIYGMMDAQGVLELARKAVVDNRNQSN